MYILKDFAAEQGFECHQDESCEDFASRCLQRLPMSLTTARNQVNSSVSA